MRVAPFTGAWIEIGGPEMAAQIAVVAPFTGAWIEILSSGRDGCMEVGRSLHGSVD